MPEQIKLDADFSDAISEMKEFAQGLEVQATAASKFTETLAKFNAQGLQTQSVITALASSGERLRAVFKVNPLTGIVDSLKEFQARPPAANFTAPGLGFHTVPENPEAMAAKFRAAQVTTEDFFRSLGSGFDEAAARGEKSGKTIFITWQGVLRILEAQIIHKIFGGLLNEFNDSIATAAKYSKQIAEIQTISQDAALSTGEWQKELSGLSKEFGAAQTDVANAAYETLSNQIARGRDGTLHTAQAFEFLNTALRFGQATVSSTTDSVNVLSGAITSFGLQTSDAERVASVLFKTIDLGRVRASEMGNAIGRVGPIAQQLGVSLEEVAASVATITIRGTKFNDSVVLINNILNKLIKPTGEMKKLLDEWGVSSGEAAIQTFGFAGVLQKLAEEAQTGASRVAELFPEMRSLRGVLTLAGQGIEDFNKNLEKISSGASAFENAVNIIQNSLGQRLQKELNAVKVFFVDEIGTKFLTNILSLTDKIGGLATATKVLVELGTAFAAGWVAISAGGIIVSGVRTLITLVPLLGTLFKIMTTSSAADMFALSISIQKSGAALSTFLGLLKGAATLGIGLLLQQALFGGKASFEENLSSMTETAQEFADKIKKANKDTIDANRKAEEDATKAFEKELDLRKRAFFGLVRDTNLLITGLKDDSIDKYKEIADAAKLSAGTYTDSIRAGIKDLNSELSRIKNEIEHNIPKITTRLGVEGNDVVFQKRLQFANDIQQVQLLEGRIQQLRDQGTELFHQGTEDSVKEARRVFDEIIKLETDLFDRTAQNQLKNLQEQIRAGTARTDVFTPDGKPVFNLAVNTLALQNRINATIGTRLGLEDQYKVKLQEQQEELNRQKAAEETRVDTINQALKKIASFQVFNKEGKLAGDPQKLLADFQSAFDTINAQAVAGDKKNFQFFFDLEKQRIAVVKEVEEAILKEKSAAIAKNFEQSLDAARKIQAEAKAGIQTNQAEAVAQLTALDHQLQALGKTALLAPDALQKFGLVLQTEAKQKLQDARAGLKSVIDLETELRTKAAKGEIISDDDLIKMQRAVIAANKLTEAFATQVGGVQALDAAIAHGGAFSRVAEFFGAERDVGDQANASIREILFGIEKSANAAFRAGDNTAIFQGQLKGAEATIQRIENRLDQGGITKRFGEMNTAASAAKVTVEQMLQAIDTRAAIAIVSMVNLNRQLYKAAALQGAIPVGVKNPDEQAFGGLITRYFQKGGLVGFAPHGTDRVPAMLTVGEHVTDAQTTRAFLPLLRALPYMRNSMLNQAPQFESGGTVTNFNIGDVNVSGYSNPLGVGRTIMKELRREARRGNI